MRSQSKQAKYPVIAKCPKCEKVYNTKTDYPFTGQGMIRLNCGCGIKTRHTNCNDIVPYLRDLQERIEGYSVNYK